MRSHETGRRLSVPMHLLLRAKDLSDLLSSDGGNLSGIRSSQEPGRPNIAFYDDALLFQPDRMLYPFLRHVPPARITRVFIRRTRSTRAC